MATKKPVTAAKKPAKKKSVASAAKTTTKVTTVKAVEAPKKTAVVAKERFNFGRSPLLAAAIAEFVGAFALSALVLSSQGPQAIAMMFGYIAVVLATVAVSGAHINPAITIGAWVTRKVDSIRAVAYLVAQFLGSLLALTVVNAFVSSAPKVSEQAMMLGQTGTELFKLAAVPAGKEWMVLLAELIGVTLFAYIVAMAMKERVRAAYAVTAGTGLFVALLVSTYLVTAVGGQTTILNPAVAAAVQALSWNWWPIAIYLITPALGGVLGFALQSLLDQGDTVEVKA